MMRKLGVGGKPGLEAFDFDRDGDEKEHECIEMFSRKGWAVG